MEFLLRGLRTFPRMDYRDGSESILRRATGVRVQLLLKGIESTSHTILLASEGSQWLRRSDTESAYTLPRLEPSRLGFLVRMVWYRLLKTKVRDTSSPSFIAGNEWAKTLAVIYSKA
jgi:hypothetical protein